MGVRSGVRCRPFGASRGAQGARTGGRGRAPRASRAPRAPCVRGRPRLGVRRSGVQISPARPHKAPESKDILCARRASETAQGSIGGPFAFQWTPSTAPGLLSMPVPAAHRSSGACDEPFALAPAGSSIGSGPATETHTRDDDEPKKPEDAGKRVSEGPELQRATGAAAFFEARSRFRTPPD